MIERDVESENDRMFNKIFFINIFLSTQNVFLKIFFYEN